MQSIIAAMTSSAVFRLNSASATYAGLVAYTVVEQPLIYGTQTDPIPPTAVNSDAKVVGVPSCLAVFMRS